MERMALAKKEVAEAEARYNTSAGQLSVAFQEMTECDAELSRESANLAEKNTMVCDIGLYCTWWWYSLCNFQYRQHYENTCSYNVDC